MKLAFITDIHAHSFTDFSKSVEVRWDEKEERFIEAENGPIVLNSRLFNILSALVDVREYCIKNGISYVLNGGDTFHKRSTLDVLTFNATYKILGTFTKRGLTQVIISGNHDNSLNADYSPSSVETFKNFATVFTDLGVYTLPDGTKIAAAPWIKNKERSLKFIEENRNRNTILLAHLGVSGASLGSGYIMSDDYSLSEIRPDKFKAVLLGHYHKPQFLTDNCVYGGSLLQNDFGDEGDSHGFFVLDTVTEALEFVPLESYPTFKTVKAENLYLESSSKDYLRIKSSAKDIESLASSLEGRNNVRIEVEKEYTSLNRSEIGISTSLKDVIETYVKEAEVPENLDKDTLIRVGKELLLKVRNNDL